MISLLARRNCWFIHTETLQKENWLVERTFSLLRTGPLPFFSHQLIRFSLIAVFSLSNYRSVFHFFALKPPSVDGKIVPTEQRQKNCSHGTAPSVDGKIVRTETAISWWEKSKARETNKYLAMLILGKTWKARKNWFLDIMKSSTQISLVPHEKTWKSIVLV